MPCLTDTGALAAVPLWLLKAPVPAGAIRLYGILDATWADQEGQAHPTRKELATDLQCSIDSLDRWVRALEAVGAITVTVQTKGNSAQRMENLYTLNRTSAATLAASLRPPQTHNDNETGEGSLTRAATVLAVLDKRQVDQVQIQRRRSRSVKVSDLFVAFYEVYPLRKGRKDAARAWQQAKLDTDDALRREVMAGAARYAGFVETQRARGAFCPVCHPSTWLRGQRWCDELAPPPPVVTSQTQSIVDATAQFLRKHRG